MDLNTQKELFSYAYIQAVASAAGYSSEVTKMRDRLGVDLTISGEAIDTFPQLDIQVKCTSASTNKGQSLRFPLKLKNYNELRIEKFVPRILVVVLVPENTGDWLHQTEQELSMRYGGYWISLLGEQETKNRTSVTISLPRENLFTTNALKDIMQRIAKGEKL